MSDTIVAHATPKGTSALGIVRVSGPLCQQLFENILAIPSPSPRHAYLGHYRDLNSQVVDQVIGIFYEDGKSFTGEQMMELTCHGNHLLINDIISDLTKRGVRLAEPGEFTKRAFLSKKIDLSQAEAIAELISSKSKTALKIARNNLNGNLSALIKSTQEKLLNEQARIEAFIDFPEDDLGEESHIASLSLLHDTHSLMSFLISSSERYINIMNDFKVILVGGTNVGKSTLFNCILGYDRALVSNTPGTTRDYISKSIDLNGRLIEMFDTAGIRDTKEDIEYLGIKNTRELMGKADLIVLVLDSSLPYPDEIKNLFNQTIFECPIIIVENKNDLTRKIESNFYPENSEVLQTCAKNRLGVDELVQKINYFSNESSENLGELECAVNLRQQSCLVKAKRHLKRSIDHFSPTADETLIVTELKCCIEALGEIIGKTDNEDMLDSLFKNFCIGK